MKFFSILTDTNSAHKFENMVIVGPFAMPICARCGCYGKILMQTCPLKILDEEEKIISYEIFIQNWKQGLHEHATITEYNEVAERINNQLLDQYNEAKIQSTPKCESQLSAKVLRRRCKIRRTPR